MDGRAISVTRAEEFQRQEDSRPVPKPEQVNVIGHDTFGRAVKRTKQILVKVLCQVPRGGVCFKRLKHRLWNSRARDFVREQNAEGERPPKACALCLFCDI